MFTFSLVVSLECDLTGHISRTTTKQMTNAKNKDRLDGSMKSKLTNAPFLSGSLEIMTI